MAVAGAFFGLHFWDNCDYTSNSRRKQIMNWFGRHLSWVAVLSWVALYPLGFITGLAITSINPYISTATYYFLVYIVSAAWLFGIGGWVLRKKNRSLWNLLWLPVPFGWVVFLCLENRTDILEKEANHD